MSSARPNPGHDLRFLDLGRIVLASGGQERGPGGPRPTAVLALLLINATRWVTADALREAVWGEAAVEHAASTLETHIFRLRRAVEPERRPGEPPQVILSDRGSYRLAVVPDQVDSQRVAALSADTADLLRTGQPQRARRKSEEALALWRGRPFEPVTDEVWAKPAVTRLEEIHAQLSESYLEALLACGEPERVLAEIDPMLSEWPLRERLWQHRMTAAYRCGRVDDALDAFQRARRLFLDELGIEPGPTLRELQAAILGGDRTLLGPARGGPVVLDRRPTDNLPRRAGRMVGREAELDQLGQACTHHAVVTVTGAGGCGKTRLVIEAAKQMGSEFVDGIVFVDLAAIQDSDQVPDAVASTLGLAPSVSGRPTDTVRAFVRDRRMLLILDNCEHVLDGAATLVDELQVPGSELIVLSTSREPLDVTGELVFPLGPLPVPALSEPTEPSYPSDPEDPAEALKSPAVRLFLDRAGLGEMRTLHLEMVAAICRGVDGVPLAVELAAARARAYSLDEIAAQVAGDPAALGQVRRGVHAHQRSVRQAVDWSHRMLSPQEKLAHRRLSVIAGPFTTDTAAYVCGVSRAEMQDVLTTLVHKSMIVPLGPARPGGRSRFSQLATIRAHGQHELSAVHDLDTARRRRDERVLELARAKPRLGHPDERGWYREVDDDLASVRTTLHDLLKVSSDPAGVFVVAQLPMFFFYRGLTVEAGRWLSLAHRVPAAALEDSVLVSIALAGVYVMAGRMDAAAPLIEQAYDAEQRLTPEQAVRYGEALVQLGGACALAEEFERMTEMGIHAQRIADQTGDELLTLMAQARLAGHPTSPWAVSIPEIYDRAVELDNFFAANVAANAGMVQALIHRRPDEGVGWSDRVLELNRKHGIEQAQAVFEVRANLLAMAGKPLEALRLYSAARSHNSRAGVLWPSRSVTTGLMEQAAAQVGRDQYESAWRAGRELTLDDVRADGARKAAG